jgi:hypothetical protein
MLSKSRVTEEERVRERTVILNMDLSFLYYFVLLTSRLAENRFEKRGIEVLREQQMSH